MSGCIEGEFTCDDGQCVSMDQRCDQLPDCRDKSDEVRCNILILEKSYNKNVPPIVSKNEGVRVSISINILKLVDIKEEDYAIDIQFMIILKWKENRASYHNLKTKRSLNALRKEDVDQLWLPIVVYENTDQQETTRLGEFGNGEWETRVLVAREGNFTRSQLDVVDELEIFKGVENSLIMSQTYTHEFQCVYDFPMYPFDTQVSILQILYVFCFETEQSLVSCHPLCFILYFLMFFQTCTIDMSVGFLDLDTVSLIPGR